MTRIQIRRDTSSNWATYNPVLADGEFALETDTRKLKIGNGEQPYNDLAYQEGETYTLPPATTETLGGVKPDGTTITVDEDGTIHSAGSTPSNMVTTDTEQTITGQKEFSDTILSLNENLIRGQQSEAYRNGAGLSMGLNSVSTDGGAFAPQWKIYSTTGNVDRTETIMTTYNQSKLNSANFNAANKLVRLDESGKLPALDGSQLTNLPAGSNSLNAIIMEQANFNNYIKAGTYYWSSYAIPVNHPYGNYKGMLQVLVKENGDSPVVQIFTLGETLDTSTPPGMWIRYCNSGRGPGYQWSSWLKVNGGDAPSNMVTTDTDQTISGIKTFTAKDINFNYDITFREDNNNKDVLELSTSSVTIPGNVSLQLENGALSLNSYSTSNIAIINKENNTYGLRFSVNNDVYYLGDVNPDYSSAKQIVTTKDIGNLKYWTGTEEAYTGLAAKDADTLYRTTDTNKVFLGTIQIGGNT